MEKVNGWQSLLPTFRSRQTCLVQEKMPLYEAAKVPATYFARQRGTEAAFDLVVVACAWTLLKTRLSREG